MRALHGMVDTTMVIPRYPHIPCIPLEGYHGVSGTTTTTTPLVSGIPWCYETLRTPHVVRDQRILGVSGIVIVILTDMCNRVGD